VELARLRLEDALPFNQAGIGDLDSADFAEILGLLATARAQMPSFPSSYFVLARTLEHAPVKPAREDLGALDRAVRLFPQNSSLAYRVATVFRRLGFSGDARAVAERALSFAESDQDRALLSAFLAERPR
jgi:hypothetical protein